MNAPNQPTLFEDSSVVCDHGCEAVTGLCLVDHKPVDKATLVELGGQEFTQEQWEVIQTYAKGHALSTVQEESGYNVVLDDYLEVIGQASTGLNFMLEMQREVESVWSRLVDPSDDEAVSAYIRDVILCATDELHEVLGEVHWKPWKDKRGIRDMANYREEMADVMHFILDLYIAAGLDGRDIIMDYMTKHYENLARNQRAEYRES